jgi:hypothetical protein
MMILADDKRLRVLGKVDLSLLSKFLNEEVREENNAIWSFVDFSSYDVPLGFEFEFFRDEKSNSLIDNFKIRLERVYDSFGHNLENGIPRGFKTICKLVFYPEIPLKFKKLPVLKGWHPTKEAILLIGLQNAKIEEDINPDTLEAFIYMLYINDLSNFKYKTIGKSEFYNLLSSKYHTDNKKFNINIDEIIKLLFSKGLVKHDVDKEKLVVQ